MTCPDNLLIRSVLLARERKSGGKTLVLLENTLKQRQRMLSNMQIHQLHAFQMVLWKGVIQHDKPCNLALLWVRCYPFSLLDLQGES